MKEKLKKYFRDDKPDTISEEEKAKEKWFYRINPCDWSAYKGIRSMRKFFQIFALGTDCKCCLGMRVVSAGILGMLIGYFLGILM